MPGSAKIIIDSGLAAQAVKLGLWDMFGKALEAIGLSAGGYLTDVQDVKLIDLDEWALEALEGDPNTFVAVEAEYVARYNAIME